MTDTSGPEFDDVVTVEDLPTADQRQVFVFELPRVIDDLSKLDDILNKSAEIFSGVEGAKVHIAVNETADEVLRHFEPEHQSNLVDHARRELELLGEDPMMIEDICKVIRVFADCGHSGGSAAYAIPRINQLLRFENITPLTDDPLEWMHIAEDTWSEPGGVWQSRRRSEAFSNDGGKTYYLLSERDEETGEKGPIHESVHK